MSPAASPAAAVAAPVGTLRSRSRYGIAAAGLGLAFAAITVWVVRAPGEVTGFDEAVGTWLHTVTESHPLLVQAGLVLEVVGGVPVSMALVTVVVVGLLLAARRDGQHRRRLTEVAAFLALSASGGALIDTGVKAVVDRQRPPWNGVWAYEQTPSFPSGHSQGGITVWVALGLICLTLLPGRLRWWLGIPLIILGPTIGASRAVLGVHWPTDVLGGWTIAGCWLLVMLIMVLALAARTGAAEPAAAHPGPPFGSRAVRAEEAESPSLVADQHHDPDDRTGHQREDGPQVGSDDR